MPSLFRRPSNPSRNEARVYRSELKAGDNVIVVSTTRTGVIENIRENEIYTVYVSYDNPPEGIPIGDWYKPEELQKID